MSGINNGYNLGSDVFYSGTVGAAAEGFLRGVSAIAVSAERGDDPTFAQPLIRRVASRLLESGTRQFLNINLPPRGGTGDFEITRLGARKYMDSVESRTDPHGREYYWIGGPPTRGGRPCGRRHVCRRARARLDHSAGDGHHRPGLRRGEATAAGVVR